MFLFDPVSGNRRRAHWRGVVRGRLNESRHLAGVAARDFRNRATGVQCSLRYRLRGGRVDDETLHWRVASKLGRHTSHPKAIDFRVDGGVVTLSGMIHRHEVGRLLAGIKSIPGVREVRSELEAHDKSESVPDLQGGRERGGDKPDILQERWAPATRLLCGAVGAVLAARSLGRGGIGGSVRGGVGLALLGRSVFNLPLRYFIGVAAEPRITLQKTQLIRAPLGEVFDFFSRVENFPKFMHNVREVSRIDEERSFWTVRGPAGVDVHWTARVTRQVPGRLIAWETEVDSRVAHRGAIQFEEAEGGTRITVRMGYNPPAGIIGHLVASLFGVDPKHEMDGDIARAKTYLETGRPAHDSARRAESTPTSGL
jgi:uncharacterized membrane protein